MKSFAAVALCLSLTNTFANARIPHSYRQLQERDDEARSPNVIVKWLNAFLKPRQEQEVCYQDQYYNFVANSSTGQEVCEVIGVVYPDRTVVEEYTPTV